LLVEPFLSNDIFRPSPLAVCSLKFNRTFCLECARCAPAHPNAEEGWLAAIDSETSLGSSDISLMDDEDNARTLDIFISGGKGRHYVINGLYSHSQDGNWLYRKCGAPGDQALCIEHCEGRWQIKNQSDRGSGACLAYVEGGCRLEDCRLRRWKVVDGDDFVDGRSVRMVTVTDAD
jgi:hypothetical protein